MRTIYSCEQAKTANSTERIRIVFPTQKQGEFTLKPVPIPKTYIYKNCDLLNYVS